ncbi:hypothetical protein L479_02264 [Exiguobacterium sp. S17]|nr:hypothetical protein L479_02264 [Exiguobacterium sp. S17]
MKIERLDFHGFLLGSRRELLTTYLLRNLKWELLGKTVL